MSSEIIGELGQVGLTVSEVSTPKCPELEVSNNQLNEKKRNSSRIGPNYRIKRFRPEWMMYDVFKDWLRPHSCPEFAICTACNRVIKAGKSELEKHATGKKHLSMLKPNSNTETQNIVLVHPNTTADTDSFTESSFVIDPQEGETCQEVSFKLPRSQMEPQYERTQPVEPQPILHSSKAAVTKAAPHWKACAVINGHVTTLDLNDYKGRYLLMFFYPNDFCKISCSEVNSLSDASMELRSLGVEAVACSVDSHLAHLTWSKIPRQDNGVSGAKIALIADPTHSIAKDYGVYHADKGHALRGQFVIDKRGIVRHMSVSDSALGRGIAEIIRIVRAIQFTDETEEGCLADWKPTS